MVTLIEVINYSEILGSHFSSQLDVKVTQYILSVCNLFCHGAAFKVMISC